MHEPLIWLIGDLAGAEFAFALDGLSLSMQQRRFASAAEAIDATDDSHPELIVLAQSRPGEVSPTAVERLHRQHPLARLIVLLGAWCEGEMRTGYPIAGTTRIFWHAFPTQINRLLDELRDGHSAGWAFPRIAGQQERLLGEIPSRRSGLTVKHGRVLLVRAVNLTTFQSVADALAPQGHTCLWLDPERLVRYRDCDAIVWDAPQLDAVECRLLRNCRAALASTPIVLLAGFPRWDDHQLAGELGISALLAKPYLVADLLAAIRGAIEPSQSISLPSRQTAG